MSGVGRGFDRLSPYYDALAAIGSLGAIARSHRAHLAQVKECRRALIVGAGNGGVLRSLLAHGFQGELVSLDVSRKMLDRSRRSLGELAYRVDWRHGDVRDLDECETFDLAVTQYVLDVFTYEQLQQVIARIDRALEPRGLWLCADFSEPRGGAVRRGLQARLLGTLYGFFRRSTGIESRRLPPIEAAFVAAGYRCVARREFATGMLWATLYRKPDRCSADQVSGYVTDAAAPAKSHRDVEFMAQER